MRVWSTFLSRRFLSVTLATSICAGTAGNALEVLDFRVVDATGTLEKALRGASVLLAAEKSGTTDPQDLFANARAEYASLMGALYARGHYAPVIHVLIDGREAADIAPLDAPDRISRIDVVVEPGRVFAFSRATVAPLAPGTVLPKGFSIGRPAESGLVLESVGAAVDGWRQIGHAKAAAGAQDLTADHASATLSADVTIAPGPRLRFGHLVITGNERMREARIRAIAGLPEGAVYDPDDLKRAATRLRRTGVFKSVTLSEDETVTAPDLLGISAMLVEEKLRRISFGAEIASFDGLKVNGSWTHRNLLGGGERLTISGEVLNIGVQSGGIDYGFGLTLDRPATFTPDTTASFGIGLKQLNETDYVADVFNLSFSLSHVFSDQLSARAGLSFEYSGITDPTGSTNYRRLALPVGATWDRRDSKTDATSGFYLGAEAKPFLGFGVTDSGARVTVDGRAYRGFGETNRFVLAARAQVGAILGASLIGTPRDDLFYSGGGGTVRGQPYQSLGVNVLMDTSNNTFGTGGSYFLAGSLEARAKVTDTIGLVGFIDVGRVDAVSFFDTSGDWHAGAGLGLRYATGVGPVRLDLAMPVGGTTGDGLQIYVGLGQAF